MDVIKRGRLNRFPLSALLPLLLPVLWWVLYWPTFSGLLDRWLKWDEAVAHGLPVLLLFLYLLFDRMPEMASFRPRPLEQALALSGAVLLSVFWAVVETLHVDILAQLVLLPLLVLAYAGLFGFTAIWQLRTVWPFFLFAIPFWDYLNNPLLFLSSEMVGAMVRLVGMPALIQGNSIFIPQGHILIADGCSGLRYLIIALALGYLVALLNRYSLSKMGLTLVVAAILGLVTNWVRIFILIVVGYQTEMQSSLMSDHEYFGWALFALICLPALYLAPVIRHSRTPRDFSDGRFPSVRTGVLLGAALVTGPALAYVIGDVPDSLEVNYRLERFGTPVKPENMPLAVTAPPASAVEAVIIPQGPLYLRVDHYLRTDRDQKLVPYIKRLYDSDRWLVQSESVVQVAGWPVSRSVFRQKAGDQRVAQIQWFETGGYHSASVLLAKLWQIPAALGNHQGFTITSMQSPCANETCQDKLERLETLANAVLTDNGSK